MSAYAGWFGVSGRGDPRAVLERMLPRSADGDVAPVILHGEDWAVAIRPGPSMTRLERFDGDGALLLVGAPRERDGGSNAPMVLRGERAELEPERLDGTFLVARLSTSDGTGFEVVTDRFASHPFYFAEAEGGIVFAGNPASVAGHPLVDAGLSRQAIYDYLYLGAIPGPESVFASVRALGPGSRLDVARGLLRESSYWSPAFEPRPFRAGSGRDSAKRELRTLLLDSVRRQVDGSASPGCFLSGGLDSSSIVGMCREATGESPRTFSIGFATEDYDELEYARLVARRFGAQHHEYFVTPEDILELIPTVVTAYGQPFGNSSVIPTWHCARLAREHGVERMLAGDGGDELFGGNERYAEQLVFGLYDKLPRVARQMLVEPLASLARHADSVALARKFASYVRQAKIPMPDRLDRYNYLRVIGDETILSPEFRASIDVSAPISMKREVYRAIASGSDVNRMLGLDFKFTLTDADLPKVRVMCAEAGVDVRFPFLERPLLEFAARMPLSEKVTPARLRGFFKDSMQGFLPDEVIAKKKHGFGLPFGVWLTNSASLRERTFGLLDGIASRGIVARGFAEQLKNSLVPEQPRYYGPLVWSLIVLEAWFEEHHPHVTMGE